MGDETPCAVAVEIIPDGMEAQEIWGSTSGLVVEAAPSSAAEATWHTVERAPAPDEVRVTWIADHVLPAGGPVRIDAASVFFFCRDRIIKEPTMEVPYARSQVQRPLTPLCVRVVMNSFLLTISRSFGGKRKVSSMVASSELILIGGLIMNS